jgi:hypothetical protein
MCLDQLVRLPIEQRLPFDIAGQRQSGIANVYKIPAEGVKGRYCEIWPNLRINSSHGSLSQANRPLGVASLTGTDRAANETPVGVSMLARLGVISERDLQALLRKREHPPVSIQRAAKFPE